MQGQGVTASEPRKKILQRGRKSTKGGKDLIMGDNRKKPTVAKRAMRFARRGGGADLS